MDNDVVDMFKRFFSKSNALFFIEDQLTAINQYCEYQAQLQAKLEYLQKNHNLPNILLNIENPTIIFPKQMNNPNGGVLYVRLHSITVNNTIESIILYLR